MKAEGNLAECVNEETEDGHAQDGEDNQGPVPLNLPWLEETFSYFLTPLSQMQD